MPRRDLAKSTGAIWWIAATRLAGGPTRPVTRWGLLTVQGLTRAKAEWGKAIARLLLN